MNLDVHDDEADGPGIAPLIDVVFQLILFLLVATSLSDESGKDESVAEELKIELDLPESGAGKELEKKPELLIVNVDAEGHYVVEGRSLSRRDLRALLQETAERDPGTPVSVRGDRNVALQHVVDVMTDCHALQLRKLDIRVRGRSAKPKGAGTDPLDIGTGR
ncbi:MAG: biopolymer transporter ExbD [Planctomycetes bacterium]|nr:biopolymer transporter ExbD [Planctomycetota bacterium]